MGVHVGGLDGAPLLAIAGCHCWAAIAANRGGCVYKLADWMW